MTAHPTENLKAALYTAQILIIAITTSASPEFIYMNPNRSTRSHGFRKNLKKFAASLGKANLYHEMMRFAYFFLIHEPF